MAAPSAAAFPSIWGAPAGAAETTVPAASAAPRAETPIPAPAAEEVEEPEADDEEDEDEDDEDEEESEGGESLSDLTREEIGEAVDIIFSTAFNDTPNVKDAVQGMNLEQQHFFAGRLEETKTAVAHVVWDYVQENPTATLDDVISEVGSTLSRNSSPARC
jgi:hypothetical protein